MVNERKDVEIQKMAKLKILVNFQFLKWFHEWTEKKFKVIEEDGELKFNK